MCLMLNQLVLSALDQAPQHMKGPKVDLCYDSFEYYSSHDLKEI